MRATLDDCLFDRAPLTLEDIPRETFRYDPTPFAPSLLIADIAENLCACGNTWRTFHGFYRLKNTAYLNRASTAQSNKVNRNPGEAIDREDVTHHKHDTCIACYAKAHIFGIHNPVFNRRDDSELNAMLTAIREAKKENRNFSWLRNTTRIIALDDHQELS